MHYVFPLCVSASLWLNESLRLIGAESTSNLPSNCVLLEPTPMKLLILLLMALPFFSFASNRPVGKAFASRSEVIAQQGMACTSQPLATQAALDVLKQGGSAVDAAIAANAVLGVVEPMSCGIGADLFAIVWDTKTPKLHGLNASGRSPAALKREHFTEKKLTSIGMRQTPRERGTPTRFGFRR